MSVGLQIWNADGKLILDADTRCGRIKGIQRVDGNPGSVSADLSDGTPFYSFQPDQLYFHINNETPPPIISTGPTGVSWTYSSTASLDHPNPITGYLIYGVF